MRCSERHINKLRRELGKRGNSHLLTAVDSAQKMMTVHSVSSFYTKRVHEKSQLAQNERRYSMKSKKTIVRDHRSKKSAASKIFFQDFFSGSLDSSYHQFPEASSDRYTIVDGYLKITAPMGQDLWGGVPLKRGAPLLLHAAPGGDYEVESNVESQKPANVIPRINTQVGLFIFEDVENWLFFGFTFHSSQAGALPQGHGLIVTSTRNDSSRIVHYEDYGPPLNGTLKIVKSGTLWRFYVKAGNSWIPFGVSLNAPLGNHEAGMGAKSFKWGGSAAFAYFDYFIIRN